MSSKASPAGSSAIHPPVGTLIDGDSLELVEVLGVGGYGVVYRAVETRSLGVPKSYAVKCLVHSGHQTARQRQVHIREIALHQIASAHPGVVTLHRVVENYNHTYIIMDYAPDHDLFTQILHSCRYLGDDVLIKLVFLQLLDAVEYCHSLGIYHRDLKPENVLCFEDGLRVAITDFGLATTEKISDEFRTGSVYHMSPECQGGVFAPMGHYSPMFNDIWSLGIILLNLATGRNPWKSATPDDPTFQAYLRDPAGFLPTVLPISPEVNEILVQMLHVDWRQRMTLREVRYAIEDVQSFYSDGVIFEGSMARCPWESGMDIDSDSSVNTQDEYPLPKSPSPQPVDPALASHWSKDTTSDIVFATQSLENEESYGAPWTNYSSCAATWAFESTASASSDYDPNMMEMLAISRTPSWIESPTSSMPVTPSSIDLSFGTRPKARPRAVLKIDTKIPDPRFHEANASVASSSSSSMMQTAIEYDPYSSLFYLASPTSSSKIMMIVPDSAVTAVTQDKEMMSPFAQWPTSATEMSSPSVYSTASTRSSVDQHRFEFTRSGTPSPEPAASKALTTSPLPEKSQPSSIVSTLSIDVHSTPRHAKFSTSSSHDCKPPKTTNLFALKLFPRSAPSAIASHSSSTSLPGRESTTPELPVSSPCVQAPAWAFFEDTQPERTSQLASLKTRTTVQVPRGRRTTQLRSPKNWFLPGRFFASAGAA